MTMKRLLTLAAMPLLALTLSACALLETNELAPTITDIVVETDAVSILKDAVVQQGLDEALADKSAKYTVFAPTDEAFGAFLEETGLTKEQLLARDDLSDFLLYHVVDGELPAAKVIATAPGTVTTLQGNDISYDLVGDDVVLTDAAGRDVTVVQTDITAFNGVIHLVDRVLSPVGTITDIAVANASTTVLEAAVVQADLAGALANPALAATVFVPTDEAFAQFLEDSELSAEQLLAADNLAAILTYHVVTDGILFASDVVAAAGATGTTVNTLNGATIDVDVVDGGVQLTDGTGRAINVVATDISALNGVIHLIDYVLLPPAAE